MKLKKLLEMSAALLPNVSIKNDFILLKQLKAMYKKDIAKFEKALKQVNAVRKSEDLEPIHRNEILSGSIKSDIKRETSEKEIYFSNNGFLSFGGFMSKETSIPIFLKGKEYNIKIKRENREKYAYIGSTNLPDSKIIKYKKRNVLGEIRLSKLNKKIILKAAPGARDTYRFVIKKL